MDRTRFSGQHEAGVERKELVVADQPGLAELMAKGKFFRSDLDEYLAKKKPSKDDLITLANDQHWSDVLLTLDIADHSLPLSVIEAMSKRNSASAKLFNFFLKKIEGIKTVEDLYNHMIQTRSGRYNLINDLNRDDGVFRLSRPMVEKFIEKLTLEDSESFGFYVYTYFVSGIKNNRIDPAIFDEKLIKLFIDKKVVDFWLIAYVSSMSWPVFKQAIRALHRASGGNNPDFAQWMLVRTLGERQYVNQQTWIEVLEIPDMKLDAEFLDLALEYKVLSLFLENDRFKKVTGWQERHFDGLVAETVRNSNYDTAQKNIDDMIAICRTLPGFKITAEHVKKFLKYDWQPKTVTDLDYLVDRYGKDLLSAAPEYFDELFKEKKESVISKEDITVLIAPESEKRKLWFMEQAHPDHDPKRRWRVPLLEIEVLSEAKKIAVADISNESAAKQYAQTLQELAGDDRFKESLSDSWGDAAVLAGIHEFAAVFGYERTMAFAEGNGNRHDVFYASRDIVHFYRQSGLGEKQFFGNILQQVARDDGRYPQGSSYGYFNALATNLTAGTTLGEKLSALHRIAAERKDIPALKEAVDMFKTPKDVCFSWPKLKRFVDILELAEQCDFFDELVVDRSPGYEERYKFATHLILHKDSKVNIAMVKLLLKNPAEFLDVDDAHAAQEIHKEKKPSRFTSIPNLDLTAVELRDAYIGGYLDKLQAFPPLSIEYVLDGALFGLGNETITIVAKVNRKSDPDAAIAGDDTACCMPFGSGKNTVYTFNLGTALFTLQLKRKDGSVRTIAESVLTKDVDVKRRVDDILYDLKIPTSLEETAEARRERQARHDKSLHEIIPPETVVESGSYLSCDNVEVNENYKKKYQRVIKEVYSDFFREYLDRFGKNNGLATDRVPVGKGNSDALTDLPPEDNTYIARAPVSYSDKTHDKVLMLKPERSTYGILSRRVENVGDSTPKNDAAVKHFVRGVHPLTYEDSLPVSYLESKAYSDNKSMVGHISLLENTLMAQDINNLIKGRPNLSSKYVAPNGRIRGALIAYEGVRPANKDRDSERIVYLNNLTSDLESQVAGGRLLLNFINQYKENYLDPAVQKNEIPLPIHTLARDKTSYVILMNNLEKIAEGLGLSFKLEEEDLTYIGGDKMHPVTIRWVKK